MSSTGLSAEYNAPTKAPTLLPATTVASRPNSCMAFITPICAMPRTPPPESTKPMDFERVCIYLELISKKMPSEYYYPLGIKLGIIVDYEANPKA